MLFSVSSNESGAATIVFVLVVVGFLGGFTTFSAFSAETLGLLQSGHLLRAGLNVGLSVALCLIAAALGFGAATWLHQTKGV